MKFLLISPKNRTVYNFRGDLIKELINRGYEVLVTGPDQTDVDRIKELGAKFVEIPMNKTGTSILGDLKYCAKLFSLIKEEKPDISLGYTVKPVVYGAIAAHFAGVPNINGMVTGGGYTFTAKTIKARILGQIVRFLYRIGFHYTNHVIFQNKDDMDEFCALHLTKPEKCSVVNGSGVNMEHFSPTLFPETTRFFMLSRLLKSKGVMEYIEAARIVKKEYPYAKFYLLGKYEAEMQDAVPKELIEASIQDGIVERFEETSDVRPYYTMCSVYVLPSYREGTPRTVLEAMSMGRPILTTNTNGCRETVRDGITGYFVPIGDAQVLADKMKLFLMDPKLAETMGRNSIILCREKFEVSRVNQKMIEIMGV